VAPAPAGAEEPVPGLDAPAVELAEAIDAVTAPAAPAAVGSHDATTELRDLVLVLPQLEGSDRRTAQRLLARPPADDSGGEPFGGEWGNNANEATPVDTAHFRVHYVTNTVDAPPLDDLDPLNGIPDYVDSVAGFAEDSYIRENSELGWPNPKPDGNRGGNSKTDIYLSQVCQSENECVFGYANTDDPSPKCFSPPFKCFAYLVLDDDYDDPPFGDYPSFEIPLQATMAHEYNHVLQFNLDAFLDAWMFESTAVWMEEEVFPENDDWLDTFMGRWARDSDTPITDASGTGGYRIYGSAVWNHWLTRGDSQLDDDVVLASWKRARKGNPKDFAVGAYDRGIRSAGGAGFSREFAEFAAATSEWRTGDGNFPDAPDLPDVHRSGRVRPGKAGKHVELDHGAYRLLRVRAGHADKLRLRVRGPAKTSYGIALVGRDGTPTGGDVVRRFRFKANGGDATVSLPDAGSFERVTVVIANADGRVNGPGAGDWNYIHDNRMFRVRLRRG
jgi:hypothetical protein